MANKPGSKNWNDIQMVMAAMAMTLTIGLWSIFADQDLAKAQESSDQPAATPTTGVADLAGTPTALPPVKIMLGGNAPQLQVVQQPSAARGSRRGGGGGGSVATTRSS